MYEKIILLYPSLENKDFLYPFGTILLQDNSDGNGVYIKEWNHPTLARPTDEELA
jgi:hypothetical protein